MEPTNFDKEKIKRLVMRTLIAFRTENFNNHETESFILTIKAAYEDATRLYIQEHGLEVNAKLD